MPHCASPCPVLNNDCRYFLTGSYDGNLRLFDYSQNLIQTVPVHSAAMTSAVFIRTASSDDTKLVATASHDLTACISEIVFSSPNPSSKTLASLHLHTGALTSVSAHPSGSLLLTSSTDGLIGLWDTTIPKTDEVPSEDASAERKKRRKLDDGESKPKRKAPTSVLKSHTARVSKAVFARDGGRTAVSAGFDSTVRMWDIENGVCTRTIVRILIFSHAAEVLTSRADRLRKTLSRHRPPHVQPDRPRGIDRPNCLPIRPPHGRRVCDDALDRLPATPRDTLVHRHTAGRHVGVRAPARYGCVRRCRPAVGPAQREERRDKLQGVGGAERGTEGPERGLGCWNDWDRW
jgi:hypothetical protein